LVIRLKKLVEAQHLKNLVESETRNNTDEDKQIFVGESNSIKRIKDVIGKISDTNSTVLITGESGHRKRGCGSGDSCFQPGQGWSFCGH
jgi:two-component system response regulator AtoC